MFNSYRVPEISVLELKTLIEDKTDFLLLDVREPLEYRIAHLQGKLVPLGELPQRLEELDAYKDKPVIVHCRSGRRSAQAVAFLQQHGFEDVKNLKGGILAWSREVDPTVPMY